MYALHITPISIDLTTMIALNISFLCANALIQVIILRRIMHVVITKKYEQCREQREYGIVKNICKVYSNILNHGNVIQYVYLDIIERERYAKQSDIQSEVRIDVCLREMNMNL